MNENFELFRNERDLFIMKNKISETLKWKKCKTMGKASVATYFHNSTRVYNKIFVWGGVRDEGDPLSAFSI
jgi:hypothetical protein